MTDLVLARTQTLTSGTALTLIGTVVNPAGPVSIAITGTGGALTGGIVAVVGLDENGDAQNENVSVAAGVGTYETTNDFTSVTSLTPSGATFTGYSAQVTFDDGDVSYNCDCGDTSDYETLAQLRTRMLVRLGYAAQAASPPPGMATLLDDFLKSAQRVLFKRFKEQRITRFFTWQMEVGVRFYDIPLNQDTCTKRLDSYDVKWVGVEDANLAWLPLVGGIPPEAYTMVSRTGLPGRYEIRQCIEVFPAPDRPYKLRIKAGFKLGAFTADGDQTSIDSELVFLWALANAKNHYGHPDADAVASQASRYLGDIVAGTHGTNRYVPGTTAKTPLSKPIFLPIQSGQS